MRRIISILTSIKIGHNRRRTRPIVEGEMGAPDEELRKGRPHFARLALKEVFGDARRRIEEKEVSKLLAHDGAELHQCQQRLVPVGRRPSQRFLCAPTDGEKEARDQLE